MLPVADIVVVLNLDHAWAAAVLPNVVRTIGDVLKCHRCVHGTDGNAANRGRAETRCRKSYRAGNRIEIAQLRHRDRSVNVARKAVNSFARFFVSNVYRGVLRKENDPGLQDAKENQTKQTKHANGDHHLG